jgi:hypothetical protein
MHVLEYLMDKFSANTIISPIKKPAGFRIMSLNHFKKPMTVSIVSQDSYLHTGIG